MRRPNSKVPFEPGFSMVKKILSLVVLFCFLISLNLVYAGGQIDPDNPLGEHPWDELNSGDQHLPPFSPEDAEVLLAPWGNFGWWILIYFHQAPNEHVSEDPIKTKTTDEDQGRFFK